MPQAWRPTHPGDPPPKWGLSKAGRLVIAISVAVGVVIAFMIIAIRPAGASESLASPDLSQEPSPEPPPWFGGRVEMPEHGFALTLPRGWVAFDTRAEIDPQVEALLDVADPSTLTLISPEGLLRMLAESQGEVVMLDLAGGPSDPSCSLRTVAPEPRLSEVADEMYADLDSKPEVIYLDGPLWLPTDVGPSFSIEYHREVESSDPQSVTTGMVEGDGFAILLTCTETAETAADDWMDITATLELMPPAYAPDDLAVAMPWQVGDLEHIGTESAAGLELLEAVADTNRAALTVLTARLGKEPADFLMASSAWSNESGFDGYGIVALRVKGVPADVLMDEFQRAALERHDRIMVPDPERVSLSVAGRIIFPTDAPDADQSFMFFYPHGEVLLQVIGFGDVTVEEIAASLP